MHVIGVQAKSFGHFLPSSACSCVLDIYGAAPRTLSKLLPVVLSTSLPFIASHEYDPAGML